MNGRDGEYYNTVISCSPTKLTQQAHPHNTFLNNERHRRSFSTGDKNKHPCLPVPAVVGTVNLKNYISDQYIIIIYIIACKFFKL